MIEKFKEKGYIEAYMIKDSSVRKILTNFKKSKQHINYSNPSNYYIHVVFIDCDRPYSAYFSWRDVFKTKEEAVKQIERMKNDSNWI